MKYSVLVLGSPSISWSDADCISHQLKEGEVANSWWLSPCLPLPSPPSSLPQPTLKERNPHWKNLHWKNSPPYLVLHAVSLNTDVQDFRSYLQDQRRSFICLAPLNQTRSSAVEISCEEHAKLLFLSLCEGRGSRPHCTADQVTLLLTDPDMLQLVLIMC